MKGYHRLTPEQRYQWASDALFEIERRMRRVDNYKKLCETRAVLKQEVTKQKKTIKNVA